MSRGKFLSIIILAAVIFSGCGNNPPELKQLYSQINIKKSPEYEQLLPELVVFVSVDDEDGSDDIESLHIINENDQLFWSVDVSSWSSRDSRGMKWVGYEKLLTVDGSLPDPGEYRVLVTDRGGENVENSIFLPLITELPVDEDFPSIRFLEGSDDLEIESPEKQNIISFYNQNGSLLGVFGVTPGRLSLKKLKDGASILENFKTVEISYYSNKFGAGIIAGPFKKESSR